MASIHIKRQVHLSQQRLDQEGLFAAKVLNLHTWTQETPQGADWERWCSRLAAQGRLWRTVRETSERPGRSLGSGLHRLIKAPHLLRGGSVSRNSETFRQLKAKRFLTARVSTKSVCILEQIKLFFRDLCFNIKIASLCSCSDSWVFARCNRRSKGNKGPAPNHLRQSFT